MWSAFGSLPNAEAASRTSRTSGATADIGMLPPLKPSASCTARLRQYEDTELQSAIMQAGYAAVIKTELDWSTAMQVLGAQVLKQGQSANPIMDMVSAHLSNAATYYKERNITWRGAKIPHLMP